MAANTGKGTNDGEDERNHQSTLRPESDSDSDNGIDYNAGLGFYLARELSRAMSQGKAKTGGQGTSRNNNNNNNSNDVDQKYKCRTCGLEFDSMKRLSGHMKLHRYPRRPQSGLPPPDVPNIYRHNPLLKPDTDATAIAAAPPSLKEEIQHLGQLNVSPPSRDIDQE